MNHLSRLTPNERKRLLSAINTCCQVFWGPSTSLCETLMNKAFHKDIQPMQNMDTINLTNIIEGLGNYLEKFKSCEDLCNDLEPAYVTLFISNRRGRIVPLYQSCYEYENAPMMGASAIAMKERLEKAGLSMKSRINEPPDHLCVEMEYLYFLCDKGWRDEDRHILAEAASFSSDILLPWAIEFRKKLLVQPDASFYSLFTAVMIAVLRKIANVQ